MVLREFESRESQLLLLASVKERIRRESGQKNWFIGWKTVNKIFNKYSMSARWIWDYSENSPGLVLFSRFFGHGGLIFGGFILSEWVSQSHWKWSRHNYRPREAQLSTIITWTCPPALKYFKRQDKNTPTSWAFIIGRNISLLNELNTKYKAHGLYISFKGFLRLRILIKVFWFPTYKRLDATLV